VLAVVQNGLDLRANRGGFEPPQRNGHNEELDGTTALGGATGLKTGFHHRDIKDTEESDEIRMTNGVGVSKSVGE
jgi:hypothetical protein